MPDSRTLVATYISTGRGEDATQQEAELKYVAEHRSKQTNIALRPWASPRML